MANIETISYKKRGDVLPLEKDDMTACLQLAFESLKNNQNAVRYPNTPEGLGQFRQRTVEYFEHVDRINKDLEDGQRLIPDIESWALYCGLCRRTILNYENRGGEWRMFVRRVKDALTMIKKQMAFRGKLPPIVLFFDLTNNSDYVNASEFKISRPEPEEKQQMRLEDLPDLPVLEAGDNTAVLDVLPELDEVEN